MSSVLDELANESGELDRTHVEERVDDWRDRIRLLYQALRNWLPAGLSADTLRTVSMHEELMKAYGVGPIDLPVFTVLDESEPKARLVPRGLWIIGANGRLDSFAHGKQSIVVDRAEIFGVPRWEIVASDKRRNPETLTADAWRRALGL